MIAKNKRVVIQGNGSRNEYENIDKFDIIFMKYQEPGEHKYKMVHGQCFILVLLFCRQIVCVRVTRTRPPLSM